MPITKAQRLLALTKLGNNFNVPSFTIFPQRLLKEFFQLHPDHRCNLNAFLKGLHSAFVNNDISYYLRSEKCSPDSFKKDLSVFLSKRLPEISESLGLKENIRYAVRSSWIEDLSTFSNAGAFVSKIDLANSEVPAAVAEVVASYFDPKSYYQLATLYQRHQSDAHVVDNVLSAVPSGLDVNTVEVIVQEMAGLRSRVNVPNSAPLLPANILIELFRKIDLLSKNISDLDTEWVLQTKDGAVSILAFNLEPASGLRVTTIAAAFGVGTVVRGDGVPTSTYYMVAPTGDPHIYLAQGGAESFCPLDENVEDRQLFLLQIRPANKVKRLCGLRINKAAIPAGVLLYGGKILAGGISKIGSLIISVSLKDALVSFQDLALNPQNNVVGVAVKSGSPLDHPAIVFRQLGLPVFLVDDVVYEALLQNSADSQETFEVFPSDGCICWAKSITALKELRPNSKGKLSCQLSGGILPYLEIQEAKRNPSIKSLLQQFGLIVKRSPKILEKLEILRTLFDTPGGHTQAAACLKSIQKEFSSLTLAIPDSSALDAYLDLIKDILSVLQSLIHRAGKGRQSREYFLLELESLCSLLSSAPVPTSDLIQPLPVFLADLIEETLAQTETAEHARDVIREYSKISPHTGFALLLSDSFKYALVKCLKKYPQDVHALAKIDSPWSLHLRLLAKLYSYLGGPMHAEDTCLFGIMEMSEEDIAAFDGKAHPLLEQYLKGIIDDILFVKLAKLLRVLRMSPLDLEQKSEFIVSWLASTNLKELDAAYPDLLSGLAFYYSHTSPDVFYSSFEMIVISHGEIAEFAEAYCVRDMGVVADINLTGLLQVLSMSKGDMGKASAVISAAEVVLSFISRHLSIEQENSSKYRLLKCSYANLLSNYIDVRDKYSKFYAVCLAEGQLSVYEPYRQSLISWAKFIGNLPHGKNKRISFSLRHIEYHLKQLGIQKNTNLALGYNETWEDRLADFYRPLNLHQVHNNLHQSSLYIREKTAQIVPTGFSLRLYELSNSFRIVENPILKYRPDILEIRLGLTVHKASAIYGRDGWFFYFTEPPSSRHTYRGRIARLVALGKIIKDIEKRNPGFSYTSKVTFFLGDAGTEIRVAKKNGRMTEEEVGDTYLKIITLFDSTYQFSGEPVDTTTHLDEFLRAGSNVSRLILKLPEYRSHLDNSGFALKLQENRFSVFLTHVCLYPQLFQVIEKIPLRLADINRVYKDLIKSKRYSCRSNEYMTIGFALVLLFPEEVYNAVVNCKQHLCVSDNLLLKHLLARNDYAEKLFSETLRHGRLNGRNWRLLWDYNPWYVVQKCLKNPQLIQMACELFVSRRTSFSADICFFAYFLEKALMAVLEKDSALSRHMYKRILLYLSKVKRGNGALRIHPDIAHKVESLLVRSELKQIRRHYSDMVKYDVRYEALTPVDG